jgi:hypothetical protein
VRWPRSERLRLLFLWVRPCFGFGLSSLMACAGFLVPVLYVCCVRSKINNSLKLITVHKHLVRKVYAVSSDLVVLDVFFWQVLVRISSRTSVRTFLWKIHPAWSSGSMITKWTPTMSRRSWRMLRPSIWRRTTTTVRCLYRKWLSAIAQSIEFSLRRTTFAISYGYKTFLTIIIYLTHFLA